MINIDIRLIKDLEQLSKRKKQIRKKALKKFKKIANTIKIANYLDKIDNDVVYDISPPRFRFRYLLYLSI